MTRHNVAERVGIDLMPGPDTPEIDVVVPIFRAGSWLATCVASVIASTGVLLRIWLVDDDPANPLDEIAVREQWPTAAVIHMQANSGFAAACNRGIQAGSAKYVLILNQDARLEPDYVSRLVGRMNKDGGLGAVGGKLLRQEGPTAPPDGTIDSCGIEMRRGRRPVDIDQGRPNYMRSEHWREVFGVCAAAALYRRSAIELVAAKGQVFDELFFMHKEDVDLAWRLRAAGFRSGVDDSAVGYHARGVRRAPDVTGSGARSWVEGARRLVAQERRKGAAVRKRAWRNQLLMLVKNEEPADFIRSFGDLALYQTLQTGIGLLLDPLGTIESRIAIVSDVPRALAARHARRRPRSSVREWLP
jgi:GT2 family glycosyltransferase